MIADCIEYIWDNDEITKPDDVTPEELDKFISSIPSKKVQKIKEYIENLPHIAANVKFKCGKCGYQESIHLAGLESFLRIDVAVRQPVVPLQANQMADSTAKYCNFVYDVYCIYATIS